MMKFISKKQIQEQQQALMIQNQQNIINSNKLVRFSEDLDLTDFNNACQIFRDVCGQIGQLIGVEDFHGGYDELLANFDKSELNTEQGKILKEKLNLANSLCIHEGKKVGLPAPDWFFKCWGIERQ